LAKTLVERDDTLSDRDLKFARHWEVFLGDALDDYNKRGIDPVKFAAKSNLKLQAAQASIAADKAELDPLQKKVDDDHAALTVARQKLARFGPNVSNNERNKQKALDEVTSAARQADADQATLDQCKSTIAEEEKEIEALKAATAVKSN
jgi:chromosome segregation ATPase